MLGVATMAAGGRDAEAAEQMRRGLERFPRSSLELTLNFGVALSRVGTAEADAESLAAFRRAADLWGSSPEAAFNLGDALARTGAATEAGLSFSRARVLAAAVGNAELADLAARRL